MSILEARVKARNQANAYGIELYTKLEPIFHNFIGKQILKKDGPLLTKIQNSLPKLPYGHKEQVYRYQSYYSLMYIVRISENYTYPGGNAPVYEEANVYIGHLQDNILTAMYEPFTARTDYTVEEVLALRTHYEKYKKLASDALSALNPFGEYDR